MKCLSVSKPFHGHPNVVSPWYRILYAFNLLEVSSTYCESIRDCLGYLQQSPATLSLPSYTVVTATYPLAPFRYPTWRWHYHRYTKLSPGGGGGSLSLYFLSMPRAHPGNTLLSQRSGDGSFSWSSVQLGALQIHYGGQDFYVHKSLVAQCSKVLWADKPALSIRKTEVISPEAFGSQNSKR